MENARLREILFTLLASLFLQPPEMELVESLWPILISGVSTEGEIPALPDIKRIRETFTRLLVGPGKDYVPPYASIYLNRNPYEKPTLWGPEAVRLQMEYEAAGLSFAPGGLRIPDHLGVELQFVAFLCQKEVEAWQNGDVSQAQDWYRRQEIFAQEHLLTWLPSFATRLRQAKGDPFYLLAVRFLQELLRFQIGLEACES